MRGEKGKKIGKLMDIFNVVFRSLKRVFSRRGAKALRQLFLLQTIVLGVFARMFAVVISVLSDFYY